MPEEATQERVWRIVAGEEVPYLWVELNGRHYKTFSQGEPRRVKAKSNDDLALFNSPGTDMSGRVKGALVDRGPVDQLAEPDEPEGGS